MAGDGRRPAGVTVAEALAARFFASLPQWSSDVTTFLEACQYIGRQADPYRGIVFTDPLDGAEIRWNPVQWATKKIGDYKIEARLPGRLTGRKSKKRFVPLPPNQMGEFQVDRVELQQLAAPCLVHALDAYFNGLVVTVLSQVWRVRDVVAVHDGWFVPEYIDDTDIAVYGRESGAEVLAAAIGVVGEAWLKELACFIQRAVKRCSALAGASPAWGNCRCAPVATEAARKVTDLLKPSGHRSTLGGSASRRAATRVKPEQASKGKA